MPDVVQKIPSYELTIELFRNAELQSQKMPTFVQQKKIEIILFSIPSM